MNGTQIGTATKFAPMAKKVLVDIDKFELQQENKVKVVMKSILIYLILLKSLIEPQKKLRLKKSGMK